MCENSRCSAVADDTRASIASLTLGAVRPPVTAYGRTGEAGSGCNGDWGWGRGGGAQPPLFHLWSVTYITWSGWRAVRHAPPE
ncbi:hypothetical protein GCM10010176_042600 [Nonomuraea spiralis]|nr:hypothetical protein GCM10010176_042600 [Nonomuraea spiralis]